MIEVKLKKCPRRDADCSASRKVIQAKDGQARCAVTGGYLPIQACFIELLQAGVACSLKAMLGAAGR